VESSALRDQIVGSWEIHFDLSRAWGVASRQTKWDQRSPLFVQGNLRED
jgi:hypothetical protein